MNDIAMEIEGNYTISSYDSYFPYLENISDIMINHLQNNRTTYEEINLITMILNLNWVRYVDTSNRFFRIFFKNLPSTKESLIYWDENEKNILSNIIKDHNIKKDLLFINNTNRDFLLEDIKKQLKKIDPEVIQLILADHKIDEAIDVIYSRSFQISLKGWKIIHGKYSQVDEDDTYDMGYILVPSADAINHETFQSERPDLKETQVKYEKGKVVIRAGRNFKKGEEFMINYAGDISVYQIFRKYGFVPIEALYNNMVWRMEFVDMSQAPVAGRKICLALGACKGYDSETVFGVPKFTNKFDLAHLSIERLNHWFGHPFVEEKMFDIYNQIVTHTHQNTTEGMALSKFAHSFYGYLLYSSNFKIDITTLTSLYNSNEDSVPMRQNIQEHFLQHKLKLHTDYIDNPNRFREILKYCLVNHHIVALNTGEVQKMLNSTLDNLFEELKNEIIEQVN
jgi:hypothetical protein